MPQESSAWGIASDGVADTLGPDAKTHWNDSKSSMGSTATSMPAVPGARTGRTYCQTIYPIHPKASIHVPACPSSEDPYPTRPP